jgi:hypothetical protein
MERHDHSMSWEPIGHVSPLPPIDLHAVRKAEPATEYEKMMFNYEQAKRAREGERIWQFVVQAAEANG